MGGVILGGVGLLVWHQRDLLEVLWLQLLTVWLEDDDG